VEVARAAERCAIERRVPGIVVGCNRSAVLQGGRFLFRQVVQRVGGAGPSRWADSDLDDLLPPASQLEGIVEMMDEDLAGDLVLDNDDL
jgi:hypothetical protein